MECHDFKQWLLRRDACDAETSRRAREHRETCPPCGRLYSADEGLEKALSAGVQAAEAPSGMVQRARALAGEKNAKPVRRRPAWLGKALAPALAVGLMLVFVIWNPFTNPLTSLDALSNYALANHTRQDMTMAFRADETPDPQNWFSVRLNFRIALPNLRDRGYVLRGGRECTIGPHKAAYLFYDDHGHPVSVFIIPAAKVKTALQENRRYRIDAPAHRVDLWQTKGMVCILVKDRSTALPAAI